jgi:hypothetical protein
MNEILGVMILLISLACRFTFNQQTTCFKHKIWQRSIASRQGHQLMHVQTPETPQYPDTRIESKNHFVNCP